MAELSDVVKTLSDLKISEVAKLVKMLEEEWGVSAAAPVAVAAAAGDAGAGAAAEIYRSGNGDWRRTFFRPGRPQRATRRLLGAGGRPSDP